MQAADKYTLWLLCETPPWRRFTKALSRLYRPLVAAVSTMLLGNMTQICRPVVSNSWCAFFSFCVFPNQIHLIQLIGLLVETTKPEMFVSYKRKKQNVYCWESTPGPGLRNITVEQSKYHLTSSFIRFCCFHLCLLLFLLVFCILTGLKANAEIWILPPGGSTNLCMVLS